MESMSFDAPETSAANAVDSYESDPAHPVPYRNRPVDMTYPQDHPGNWYTWLVQDQRFVNTRPDVLTLADRGFDGGSHAGRTSDREAICVDDGQR